MHPHWHVDLIQRWYCFFLKILQQLSDLWSSCIIRIIISDISCDLFRSSILIKWSISYVNFYCISYNCFHSYLNSSDLSVKYNTLFIWYDLHILLDLVNTFHFNLVSFNTCFLSRSTVCIWYTKALLVVLWIYIVEIITWSCYHLPNAEFFLVRIFPRLDWIWKISTKTNLF